MSGFMRLVLILFGLAYLISPVDLIPDLLVPWLGWIDDGVIVWSVYYLIRYGELPWFLFKKKAGPRVPGRPPRPKNTSRAAGPGKKQSHQAGARGSASGGPDSAKEKKAKRKNTASDKSPHEILGVAPNASQQEIQRAYKEKIKQYHPDKLSHLGKEFADLANEKFLEIQTAYEALTK